ncbi:hypothetical protein F2P81_007038 [Scophthalmus maximus]|uniref:Uncharacterized protein n=1 Tax=Scophthalmus maximus TaxID=52904 RepID=A0A6A4TBF5_SCOMX|nr:hypothetical protein F2P81_007038 [Scophthalmus maximus]
MERKNKADRNMMEDSVNSGAWKQGTIVYLSSHMGEYLSGRSLLWTEEVVSCSCSQGLFIVTIWFCLTPERLRRCFLSLIRSDHRSSSQHSNEFESTSGTAPYEHQIEIGSGAILCLVKLNRFDETLMRTPMPTISQQRYNLCNDERIQRLPRKQRCNGAARRGFRDCMNHIVLYKTATARSLMHLLSRRPSCCSVKVLVLLSKSPSDRSVGTYYILSPYKADSLSEDKCTHMPVNISQIFALAEIHRRKLIPPGHYSSTEMLRRRRGRKAAGELICDFGCVDRVQNQNQLYSHHFHFMYSELDLLPMELHDYQNPEKRTAAPDSNQIIRR